MAYIGMDSEEARRVSKHVQQEAQKLESEFTAIGNKLSAVPWKGPDREKFVAEWQSHKAQVTKVCQILRDVASTMLSNAEVQAVVSSR